MMGKKIAKIIAVIISLIICFMIIAYLFIFFNTNSLVDYVESIYRGEVRSEQLIDTWYEQFDIIRDRPEIAQVDIDVKRVFVWHNFQEGFMLVRITCMAYDADGVVTFGTDNYQRWYITKTETGWDIIKIKENTGGTLF